MSRSSIKSRFVVSLGGNLVRGVVTLLITVVLARFLGSDDYGRVAFLLATFQAIRQLTDPGVSSAFYTFLSQKERSTRFVATYWALLIVKYLFTIILIMWMMPDSWIHYIWRGETRDILVFSVTAILMQFEGWQCAAYMLESQRRTMRTQGIYIFSLVLQLILIYVLQGVGALTVKSYMLMSAAVWIAGTLVALLSYKPQSSQDKALVEEATFRKYLDYCLPIVPLTFLAFLGEFLDRWFLQAWAGSREQALFSISQQLAAGSLLITASLIRVLWKEIAEAIHENRNDHAMRLYTTSKRVLFFISAFIAGVLSSWAQEILSLVFGSTYTGAVPVFSVMVIAAAYQTLGQIEGMLLLASGRTKTGLWFNFLIAPVGIVASYLLVTSGGVDRHFPVAGIGIGALGLAIKVLAMQVVTVNVLGYLLCRQLNWRFELIYQVKILVFMVVAGFGMKALLGISGVSGVMSIAIGAALYFLSIVGVLVAFPGFFDLGFEIRRRFRWGQ